MNHISFPTEFSLGEVRWSEEELHGPRMDARGDVGVPEGQYAVLILSPEAAGALSSVRTSVEGLINAVKARDVELTDQDLRTIASWANLRKLIIRHASVTDEQVRYLTELRDLKFLALTYCPLLTDAAVQSIGEKLKLNWLFLTETNIRSIEQLKALKELHSLGLTGTPFDDQAARDLVHLEAMAKLTLTATALTSAALPYIGQLAALRVLALGETQVSDENIELLAQLDSLEAIDLTATPTTTETIRKLRGSTSLRMIFMDKTMLDDDAIPLLSEMPWLERISFEESRIGADAEAALRVSLPEAIINGVRRR